MLCTLLVIFGVVSYSGLKLTFLRRYPTPGIVNAKTGAVLDPDAFGKVQELRKSSKVLRAFE